MSDEVEVLETEEYPLATDHLVKGSVISVATIERAFNVQHGTQEYEFAALRARDYVFRQLAKRGLVVHIEGDKGALRILTDEDSVAYSKARIRNAFTALRRVHEIQKRQDRALMSDDTRSEHDRECETTGRQISAYREARKMPALVPNPRQTPALAEVKGEKKI